MLIDVAVLGRCDKGELLWTRREPGNWNVEFSDVGLVGVLGLASISGIVEAISNAVNLFLTSASNAGASAVLFDLSFIETRRDQLFL